MRDPDSAFEFTLPERVVHPDGLPDKIPTISYRGRYNGWLGRDFTVDIRKPLKIRDTGPQVKMLRAIIIHMCGSISSLASRKAMLQMASDKGLFDDEIEQAIRQFQKNMGFSVDGEVWTETWGGILGAGFGVGPSHKAAWIDALKSWQSTVAKTGAAPIYTSSTMAAGGTLTGHVDPGPSIPISEMMKMNPITSEQVKTVSPELELLLSLTDIATDMGKGLDTLIGGILQAIGGDIVITERDLTSVDNRTIQVEKDIQTGNIYLRLVKKEQPE